MAPEQDAEDDKTGEGESESDSSSSENSSSSSSSETEPMAPPEPEVAPVEGSEPPPDEILLEAHSTANATPSNFASVNQQIQAMKFVKFDTHCGYIVKFDVTWIERDSAGEYTVQKSWASGEQTSGYSYTLPLPGDARNVHLHAEAKTGLVWSPWGEIFNLMLNGPDNKTYKATGTTLNRTYEVSGP
jgi:hypothetical protein